MNKQFSPRSSSISTLAGLAEAEPASSPSSSKNPIKVTFSPSPVKTGYRTDVDPSPIKVTVTATVDPKSETKNITFAKEGVDRFSYTEVSRDESKGEIKLDIKGTSATDASKKDGDASLVAKDGSGSKVCELNVIVIIPKTIGTPHPTFDGDVTGQNVALNSASVPPLNITGITPPIVVLATRYSVPLPIKVLDQFGHTLDPMYASSPVSERDVGQTSFLFMNVTMGSSGTYVDRVGRTLLKQVTVDGETGLDAADSSISEGQKKIADWQKESPLMPLNSTDTTDMDVTVGGHQLTPSPAITNRTTITTSPPTHIAITWP